MKVLGIDLGTRKVALSLMIADDLFLAREFEVGEMVPRPKQLMRLGDHVKEFVQTYSPDWVWIESVIVGNNRKYSIALAEAKGAILSSLAQLQDEQTFFIDSVDNKSWKKLIVGNGNASKDDIKAWVREQHPPYAVLCGDDQDKYDAACIAMYGQRIVSRADGLRLG